MNNLVEQIRRNVIEGAFRTKSFEEHWASRSAFFKSKLPRGKALTRHDVRRLGDSLSEAFILGGRNDRSQGALSNAGTVWEYLIVWYVNLCLYGTSAVCVRKASDTPSPIISALSVSFHSTILRSEPDVLIFSIPEMIKMANVKAKDLDDVVDEITARNFSKCGVVNMQCKTNWNDNAQVPMLWNMLYNQARKGATIPNGFTIGVDGYSLMNLGHFGYAFATVPSQGVEDFKQTSLPVLRVRTMTAGNYWGFPSRQGVSYSLSQLFNVFNHNSSVYPNISDVGAKAEAALNKREGADSFEMFRF